VVCYVSKLFLLVVPKRGLCTEAQVCAYSTRLHQRCGLCKEHEGLCAETQRCAQGHGESLCDDARGAETTGVFAVSERTDSGVDKIVRDR